MNDIERRIGEKIKQLPEWLRHDLASKDDANRPRAEDTLAAILLAVFKD